MRRVHLDLVETGMILAKDIFNDTGRILLRANVEMKPRYLNNLRQAGIDYIYVRDNRLEDITVEDPIHEKTRHEARQMVKNITMGLSAPGVPGKVAGSINVRDRDILETVNKIIDELLDTRDIVVQMVDIRNRDNYLFAHSVNCAVLSALVAKKMHYRPKELRWVAAGALFHDLGMLTVPKNIVNKPGELSAEEFAAIKEHPLRGFEIFKTTSVFDARAGAVVFQHHERFHGQGYPRGLAGKDIYPLAQIAGIADVYDAMTSDRPYRKAHRPHEAVEMLLSKGEELFDVSVLQQFLSLIAAYPVGVHVLLSTGESGLVIDNNPGFTLRPVVRILYGDGKDLTPLPEPRDIDLSRTLDLTIIDVID